MDSSLFPNPMTTRELALSMQLLAAIDGLTFAAGRPRPDINDLVVDTLNPYGFSEQELGRLLANYMQVRPVITKMMD